ncbi:MAG TPA: cell division/cell wall cluster transcriptional repressor MraZ [Chloroflexi bacterium]|nr:cell division/cell wall cluster transcriptional repressor MraZ [Chloroflexota bacterium]
MRDNEMLLGTFKSVTLTENGLILPDDLRPDLEQGYVITRGVDGCVTVFPLTVWEGLVERVEGRLSFLTSAARLFQRLLYGGASRGRPEAGGLLPIPEYLRRYADLDGEVVLLGAGSRLEIWSPQRWSYEEFSIDERLSASLEKLSELGI